MDHQKYRDDPIAFAREILGVPDSPALQLFGELVLSGKSLRLKTQREMYQESRRCAAKMHQRAIEELSRQNLLP